MSSINNKSYSCMKKERQRKLTRLNKQSRYYGMERNGLSEYFKNFVKPKKEKG